MSESLAGKDWVAVAECPETAAWREVDPADRALALAAVRRAVFDARVQKVAPADVLAAVGDMISRYEGMERNVQFEQDKATRAFGFDPATMPRMRHNRRMSEAARLRYRFFLSEAT